MGPSRVRLSAGSAALVVHLAYVWEYIFYCASTEEAEFNG